MTIASPPGVALTPVLEQGLRQIDALADRTFAGWHVPGLVYGVVLGSDLVHVRSLGTLRVGEEAPPDERSIFRIASMTKSFTAATILSLRDDGLLRLDDEAERYVPELAGLRYPTTDSPRITIRHLLTMTAGFPTDDPWGDRQQGLDLGAFSRLLATGLSFAFAPGLRFEYSNTGYGILGRVITNVAGREYRDVVGERLLAPLGMASTSYLESDAEPARKAAGYLWRGDTYLPEPIDGYGALASMGGISTSVEDLARWVGGFIDAWPPRDGPEGPHPLRRATRREMQTPQIDAETRLVHASADAFPDVEQMAYGFGLFMVDDLRLGRFVGHGGGYPGFGTHMRWHPASGIGVIALTNHRYGAASLLAREQLALLVSAEVQPVRRIRPNALTAAARAAVEALLAEWDEARATELFAMNVDLDEPIELRRAAIERMRERHGALVPDPAEPAESGTPFHLAWWLVGERGGRVHVEIQLSPELPPKVQTLALTSVPVPPPLVERAAERIVAALDPGDAAGTSGPVAIDWPADIAAGEELDLARVVRAMRAAEARFGPLRLGPSIEGDGERSATFRVHGGRGHLDLALTIDPARGCVTRAALTPIRVARPDLD